MRLGLGLGLRAGRIVMDPPVWSVQPTLSGTLEVGSTLTLGPGTATGDGTITYTVTTLTLDGVSHVDEVDQDTLTWDTTGISVYGGAGAISFVVTATNAGGSTASNTITGNTLTDVPEAFASGQWSVAAGGANEAAVTISSLPDDGNSTITDVEYSVDGGAWTSSAGTTSFTITGVTAGSRNIRIRARNGVGPGQTSDTKSVTVTGATAVNPSITSAVYTAGAAGSPATLDLEVTYAGADTLTVYAVTGTDPVTVSTAQLAAGAGGTNTLEFFNFAYTPPTDSDPITGLTSTSESADRILLYIAEDTNGGASSIETITVSGLDFTVPTISTRATNTAGTTVVITASENIFGTEDVADWTVKEDTVSQTISSVTISGTTATLSMASALSSGTTITASYNAGTGDVRDTSGNALASFTDQAVTNNVTSYTETGVTVGAGDYLTASAAMTDAPGLLVFASYVPSADQRRHLFSWDGTNGYLRADNVGGDTLIDPQFRVKGESASGDFSAVGVTNLAVSDRMHVLASAKIQDDGGGNYTVVTTIAVWDATGTVWQTATNSTASKSVNGPDLYLSAGALRLFERNNATGSEFAGTNYRSALWTFASASNVPDVTSSTVQNWFTSGGSTLNPGISQGNMTGGTLRADFYGAASTYNAGTHDGDLTFTATGTFT